MGNFVFEMPTSIHFGQDAELKVGALAAQYGKKALILYGSERSVKSGLIPKIEENLQLASVDCMRLGGITANPTLEFTYKAIECVRKNEIDIILAVGGGSVIDTAKATSIGAVYSGDVWDFFEGKAVPEKALPIGAISTMAASASEANCVCVLSNERTCRKLAFGHPRMFPRFALLNPELTISIPSHQTAVGAIDIFAHAFERYFNLRLKGTLRDKLCAAVMSTVIQELPRVMIEPDNYDGRSELMWASIMAHSDMVGVEGVFACHEMSHVLTEEFGISHGEALSILMPAWCRYMLPGHEKYLAQFAKDVWEVRDKGQGDTAIAEEGIQRIQKFISDCGLPQNFEEYGITSVDTEYLAEKVFIGRETIGEAFAALRKKDVVSIFELAIM